MNENKEIRTGRILLRKFTEADRAECVRILTDPEVNHYMGGRTEDPVEGNKIFDKIFEIYNGSLGDRFFELWAIEYEGKMIGDFELKETDNTVAGELEVVYMIDKPYWGRGLVPEILKEIIKYSASINKSVVATLNPGNIKTVRVLEKIGIEKQEWIGEGEDRYFKVWLKM
ncbi:MAG: GNAT family N-acetyltransferase [Ignavibacteria bacterium]|nr:GNAT family N-acetyltransferase [Ignavibacteria bacterium]